MAQGKIIAVTLDEREVVELEGILLDQDKEAALEFLERIYNKFSEGKKSREWHLNMLDRGGLGRNKI